MDSGYSMVATNMRC